VVVVVGSGVVGSGCGVWVVGGRGDAVEFVLE